MNVVDVISAKRDDRRLSDSQIRWFIDTYAHTDEIADEQASALLMAIYLRGLDSQELDVWTDAMIESGVTLDLSGLDRPTVDKHSTGGVGDKISLIIVPILAACGAACPMLSGRGLGHTGGTLDKLESIPGWRADLSDAELRAQLSSIGGAIAGTTADIAPADRKLYALRDTTATVSSIPLIASSIMSKKIAEGTESLVLDVKVGSGAFIPNIERARELAHTMIGLGRSHDVRTSAILTGMNTVLGRTAGNALEVQEALDVLAGHGPPDVIAVSLALATEMARLSGVDRDPLDALASGDALHTFEAMVAAQGGRLDDGLPVAPHRHTVVAEETGYVTDLDARAVGIAAWRLGAGRARKEDPVSATAGVVCRAKPGDFIERGEPLFELHADDADRFDSAVAALAGVVATGPERPEPSPVVLEEIC